MKEQELRDLVILAIVDTELNTGTAYQIGIFADSIVEKLKEAGLVTEEEKKEDRCPFTLADLVCELDLGHKGECLFLV